MLPNDRIEEQNMLVLPGPSMNDFITETTHILGNNTLADQKRYFCTRWYLQR